MFDFNEKNFWHTDYYKKEGVLPFDVTLNLNGIAKLEKIHYLPASERETNGQIQKASSPSATTASAGPRPEASTGRTRMP